MFSAGITGWGFHSNDGSFPESLQGPAPGGEGLSGCQCCLLLFLSPEVRPQHLSHAANAFVATEGAGPTRNLVLGVCVQNPKALWAQRDCNGFLKINNTPRPVFGFRDSHSDLSPGRRINVIREQVTNNTHGPGLCQKMFLLQGKVNQQSQQQKGSVMARCLGKSARG